MRPDPGDGVSRNDICLTDHVPLHAFASSFASPLNASSRLKGSSLCELMQMLLMRLVFCCASAGSLGPACEPSPALFGDCQGQMAPCGSTT